MARRQARLLIAVVLLVLAGAAPARADAISDAAAALRSGPVYVAPGARDVLPAGEAARVEAAIRAKDPGPMYVAVLGPGAVGSAGGSVDGVAQRLFEELGRRPGTYVVAAGRALRAGSQGVGLRPGEAGALATDAIRAHGGDGLGAILVDLVDRVDAARAGGDRSGGGNGGGGGAGGLAVLGALALGGGAFALSRSRRRRRERAVHVDELREAARDDLVALGDDVRAIDVPIEQPGVDPRAREALGVALERYDEAETALDHAGEPGDFGPITQALEEGRWAMEVAKARLAGRKPPERRPPCFFDPRHGPSARDVVWAPPGGQPREVPACEADALRVEEGGEPQAREVLVGGTPTPYYMAPSYFGPWAGGFFGGFGGGLLPGMLLGTMLGGSLLGPAMAWGDGPGAGGWGGGDFGGGDFGGGDFGGGDFGGGDFGGGDFGGGDLGGGDF